MSSEWYFALIQTWGNQRFIFDTPRSAENVGASELLRRATTTNVVVACGGPPDPSPAQERAWLRGQPLPGDEGPDDVQIVMAAAGKALLFTQDGNRLRRAVTEVSMKALAEAPGLSLAAELSDPFNVDEHSAHEYVNRLFAAVATRRDLTDPNQVRHLRHPIADDCGSTGASAAGWAWVGGQPALRGVGSGSKLAAVGPALGRLQSQLDSTNLPHNVNQLERLLDDRDRQVGVVHADGNGFGRLFQSLDLLLAEAGELTADPVNDRRLWNRQYLNGLRAMTLAIDECSEQALRAALGKVEARPLQPGDPSELHVKPVVPLVLGGDDLTMLVDGQFALDMTATYLAEFEHATAVNDTAEGLLSRVARAATGQPWLTASAGVALVGPHHPFSHAHDLAENLLSGAKGPLRTLQSPSCSTLDFHVLYETSTRPLPEIRNYFKASTSAETKGPDPAKRYRLWGGPYVVSKSDRIPNELQPWAEGRTYADLRATIEALDTRNDRGERMLSSRGVHQLRDEMTMHGGDPESVFRRLQRRLGSTAAKHLGAPTLDGAGLQVFRHDVAPVARRSVGSTIVLDALTAKAVEDSDSGEGQ